ncbi:hypothetical protein DV096_17510 [Bradymonadaceae bacterium TMQ3]|nr:hypothetical protein DV096_17510 [Bradymonadaceae bacterium TMQ3]
MKRGWCQVGLALGAVVVLGACNSGPRFGEECARGECPEMIEITDDLMDQVDMVGGEGPEMALPEEGERVVFSGTVLPREGGSSFSFEGRAGQWVSIVVYSRGVRDPTFRVEAAPDVVRWSLTRDDGEFGVVRRVMMLPVDGRYRLDVFNQIRGEVNLSHAYQYGSEDAHFVGVIETISPPAARQLEVDGRAVEERFVIEERGLFELRGTGDAPVGVRVQSLHDDAFPVYALNLAHGELLASEPTFQVDTTPVRYAPTLQSLVDPSAGIYAHIDSATHVNHYGWYRISAHSLTAFEPGEQQRAQVTGEAGQIVTAYHRNWTGEPAAIEVMRDGEVIMADEARPSVGEQSLEIGPTDMAIYLDEAASFEALLTNPHDAALYEAELGLEVKEPLDVWELTPRCGELRYEHSTPVETRRSEFFLLDVQERSKVMLFVSGWYEGWGGPAAAWVDFFLYALDSRAEPLFSGDESRGRREYTLDEGRYVVHVQPYASQIARLSFYATCSVPE